MQYENKILNFHIYLYFPSNIFKKFKNIKIMQGITLRIYCEEIFLSYWMCKVIFAHSWHK